MYDIKWRAYRSLMFFFSLTGGNVSKLLEFSKDLQELLQMQVEFKLPLSSLISEYQSWFDKKTPFDPAVYGFTSVVTLLEALPAVAEVSKFVLYSDPLTPKSDYHLISPNIIILNHKVRSREERQCLPTKEALDC